MRYRLAIVRPISPKTKLEIYKERLQNNVIDVPKNNKISENKQLEFKQPISVSSDKKTDLAVVKKAIDEVKSGKRKTDLIPGKKTDLIPGKKSSTKVEGNFPKALYESVADEIVGEPRKIIDDRITKGPESSFKLKEFSKKYEPRDYSDIENNEYDYLKDRNIEKEKSNIPAEYISDKGSKYLKYLGIPAAIGQIAKNRLNKFRSYQTKGAALGLWDLPSINPTQPDSKINYILTSAAFHTGKIPGMNMHNKRDHAVAYAAELYNKQILDKLDKHEKARIHANFSEKIPGISMQEALHMHAIDTMFKYLEKSGHKVGGFAYKVEK